jgi:hypothetical protein
MSGRIQRALINIFDRERDNAFTTEACASGFGRTFIRTRSRRVTMAPSFARRVASLRSDRNSNGSLARDSAGRSYSSGTTR